MIYDLCPMCGADLDEPEDGEQECTQCEWVTDDLT